MRGNVQEVKQLLACEGIDIEPRCSQLLTPLHLACTYDQVGVVKVLLAAGANIRCAGERLQTPLHKAALEGHTDIAQILIRKEAMVDAAAGLAVEHQTHGFSHLVDTTKRFKQRHPTGAEQEPFEMPKPPVAPTRDDRTSAMIKKHKHDLIECKQQST